MKCLIFIFPLIYDYENKLFKIIWKKNTNDLLKKYSSFKTQHIDRSHNFLKN